MDRYSTPTRTPISKRIIKWKCGLTKGNRQSRGFTSNFKSLEVANFKQGLETKIEESNKGYTLLKKMGYREGQGLGKDANGMLHPLPLEFKKDRKGFGAEVRKPIGSQKEVSPIVKKQIQTDGGGKIPKRNMKDRQVVMVQSKNTGLTDRSQKLPSTTGSIQNIGEIAKQQTNMVTENPIDVQKKVRCKHSPIRAPDPSPPLKTNKNNSRNMKEETNMVLSKALRSSIDFDNPMSLLNNFSTEIELMQLSLEAAASRNPFHAEDDLIVAKICIGNQFIANHAFEFIRTKLVGWIGAYQEQGRNTPIFHSMTNNERHITVVCDNSYAYQCLEHCIDDLAQMKTMGVVQLVRLPPITSLIYCVDAMYDGIARDADMFRNQIQLHKPKLNVDQWIMILHEVCTPERKTHFVFLIDERSALVLNYKYSSNFCVCMQKLAFHNRGVVAEEYFS